jgi:hypothetical protein
MDRPRLSQAVTEYQPAGTGNPGRPLQGFQDIATERDHESKSLKTC